MADFDDILRCIIPDCVVVFSLKFIVYVASFAQTAVFVDCMWCSTSSN